MTVKQRILALEFLKKQKRNAEFAKKMGIKVKMKENGGEKMDINTT